MREPEYEPPQVPEVPPERVRDLEQQVWAVERQLAALDFLTRRLQARLAALEQRQMGEQES